jgi:oligoendopeptidase F
MSTTQTYPQIEWSLTDLFPSSDSAELSAAFTNLDSLTAEFEKNREQLTADISSETFLAIIKQKEEINKLAARLGSFSGLWYSEDTQNQAAQSLEAKVDQFLASLSNRILFFSLWWKELDDQNAKRLIAASGDYHYWLEQMRSFKPYTLTEPEEKIINIKDVTGNTALNMLYSTITNRYVFKLEVDGEVKELSRGELMVYARHHDPDLRARAYQELYRVYGDDAPILGQIYQTQVRDWRNENVDLRGFASPMATRNLANDIPDEVVNTLLDVCQKNAPVFQRFFKLKARWLGMERLRRYDVYAPVAVSDKEYTFEQASQMVLNSFNEFNPRFGSLAERVFADKHLHSTIQKGKRSGAFCAYVLPEMTPYVLVNYQGRTDDVSTLAHELGHAIHNMLSAHHSIFTAHACLPLAETASTFGEMMLVERLLEQETDEAVRRDILFAQVDDNYATILRQAYFALFEREAHEMIKNGASVDELAEAYLNNLRSQFGDAVEINDEFRWEWVSIPHIYHTPFYVYAYTFGQLLVLSLYSQFKAEGEAFKPRYIELLSAGGSAAPMEVLDKAGVDVRKASFWQGGFDVVSNMITQLESLPIPE